LGQNFLVNPRILDKIVAAAEIGKEDVILEIGPGTGNLTEKLAAEAKKVISVEKDKRLIEILKEKFKNSNVEIVESDILKLDTWTLFRNSKLEIRNSNYKVVANIPYYITSRFLRKIFTEWPRPKLIVLTIQKEVAQRIIAKPPKMNLLALSVQFFSQADILCYITKSQFRPIPKVDSAIIKLMPREKLPTADYEKFFKIVQAGFSQRRKKLIGNISRNSDILKKDLLKSFEKVGIKETARAENLSLSQWLELTKFIKKS